MNRWYGHHCPPVITIFIAGLVPGWAPAAACWAWAWLAWAVRLRFDVRNKGLEQKRGTTDDISMGIYGNLWQYMAIYVEIVM